MNLKGLEISASTESNSPTTWDFVAESTLADTEGRLQIESVKVPEDAPKDVQFFKFRFTQGWDDFASIHNIDLR